jgi:hypothetical protein
MFYRSKFLITERRFMNEARNRNEKILAVLLLMYLFIVPVLADDESAAEKALRKCHIETTKDLAVRTCDSADVVARAAVAMCSRYEEAALAAVLKRYKISQHGASKTLQLMRETDRLYPFVWIARQNAGVCAP